MNQISQSRQLYWESSYEIVLSLIEIYPDADLDSIGLQQLFRYIVDLPNFADDPEFANDNILNEILREWYEEVKV
jgi:FeS assembly protein IscX